MRGRLLIAAARFALALAAGLGARAERANAQLDLSTLFEPVAQNPEPQPRLSPG